MMMMISDDESLDVCKDLCCLNQRARVVSVELFYIQLRLHINMGLLARIYLR